MTFDEYIAEAEAKRDALRLKLHIVTASAIPQDVKNERIQEITQEVIMLKDEILATLGGLLRG
jgi:hypothetical protein